MRTSIADQSSAREAVRRLHGIPSDAFVVGFVGKYIASKRPADMIMAAALSQSRNDPYWVLLIGEGPERSALESLIDKGNIGNVVMTGFVNQSEIPKYLTAADVLASPSETEPYSLAVAEAVSMGLPVIVSDRVGCVGPADAARPGQNALVYSCGDVESLHRAIVHLQGDAVLRQRMSSVSDEVGRDQDLSSAARALESAALKLNDMGKR